MNIAYVTALIVVFLANAANVDEVDCESVQVKAKAFLKGAQQEQFTVAQQSANYSDFFVAMQKIRKASLPDESLQTIKDALVCEAATDSPDWYFVATLFVEAARGEADDVLTAMAEQFIADARGKIRTRVVEYECISSVASAYYYVFFSKPQEAGALLVEAVKLDYWTPEDYPDEDRTNREQIEQLRASVVFNLAVLPPDLALSIIEDNHSEIEREIETASDASLRIAVNGLRNEMSRRINGEAPQGMSMYYLEYQGPGAPVIRN